jgi:hypothetical protein
MDFRILGSLEVLDEALTAYRELAMESWAGRAEALVQRAG